MNVAILAAEASGDRVGGQLALALKKLAPELSLWGAGGRHLREAGVEVTQETTAYGVVGIGSALTLLPKLLAERRRLLMELARRRPDAIIAIDAGALHLGFGPLEGVLPWARRRLPGAKLIYYFPPASWRKTLTHTSLGGVTDYVATPFSWNASELTRLGVKAEWVGHPLLDSVRPALTGEEFARRYGLELSHPIVGLLPGSRKQEIRHILPVQLAAARLIRRRVPGVQFALALAPTVNRAEVLACLERVSARPLERPVPSAGPKLPLGLPAEGSVQELARRQRAWIERAQAGFVAPESASPLPLVIVEEGIYDVINASDALICTSGTATLEAAILKRPMVIVYKLGWENAIEAHLAKRRLPLVGMPNLIAGREVCRELLQEECTPEAVADEICGLLLEPERIFAMREALEGVVAQLGEPGGAERAARGVLETLRA